MTLLRVPKSLRIKLGFELSSVQIPSTINLYWYVPNGSIHWHVKMPFFFLSVIFLAFSDQSLNEPARQTVEPTAPSNVKRMLFFWGLALHSLGVTVVVVTVFSVHFFIIINTSCLSVIFKTILKNRFCFSLSIHELK